MIQSADKKNRPEKTDTKSHAEKAAHTGGKSTYLRDSPLKKKKKNAHTSWAVFPLLLECPCFPFRNTTGSPVSSLLSFIRPQIVRAEAASQRSDSSAIRHAFGLQRCLFLSILLCTPAASKAILQLGCWRQTAFHSHRQIPWAAHFSAPSLRKQNRLSSVR